MIKCERKNCPYPPMYIVQRLEYLSWEAVVEYVNKLKKQQQHEAVYDYLRGLPIASPGFGNSQITYAYVQLKSKIASLNDAIDLNPESNSTAIDESKYVKIDEPVGGAIKYLVESVGLKGDNCAFNIVVQGFCRMLVQSLLKEETKMAKLISTMYLFKYCKRHKQRQISKLKVLDNSWDSVEMVVSNNQLYIKVPWN